MATVPTPRSYPQILGDIIDTFRARTGIKKVAVGSPFLRIFEAVAQSSLRSTQDTFQLLDSNSLDRAEGEALNRIATDEGTSRQSASVAIGQVTIGDSSFTKIASTLYQGKAAPLTGALTLHVADGTSFPSSGQLYIGRDTNNYEGPLDYSAIVNSGTYWTITLTDATTKFHNLGESVVVAQGGTRIVSASTVLRTKRSTTVAPLSFVTLNQVTLEDGEDSISGVWAVAQTPGSGSNVASSAISEFASSPFSGATVTNEFSFRNGKNTETDDELRERIRAIRKSKSRGTKVAIETATTGLVSEEDGKRIISAKLLRKTGEPSVLYVDDGTGYEAPVIAVDLEYLTESAVGGEQYFQVQEGTPIAKAYLETTNSAPFVLEDGGKLALVVGGVTYEHTFSSSEFVAIANATAYEIVTSINNNPAIGFSARTSGNGTKVKLFAKSETNDDLVLTAASVNDVSSVLGVPSHRAFTMRLYKNGVLLSKDGEYARILSADKTAWGAPVSGDTLILDVDGTGAVTYTFTDNDLANLLGSWLTAINSSLPLSVWATFINSKIPGVTASVSGGRLALVSNLGKSSRASLVISGGTLVSKGIFTSTDGLSSTGASNDYFLDRNTGQIKLSTALEAGDSLVCGLPAYSQIVSSEITSIDLASDGHLWFVVDGSAEIVLTPNLTLSTSLTISESPTDMMKIAGATDTFADVAIGDWLIVWDTAINANNHGYWRIADIDEENASFIRIESAGTITGETITLDSLHGLKIVRTAGIVQKVTVAAANDYTASSLATTLDGALIGATFDTVHTNKLRVYSDSHNGSIALVSADTYGQLLTLPFESAAGALTTKAFVTSGNKDKGTPYFKTTSFDTVNAAYVKPTIGFSDNGMTTISPSTTFNAGDSLVFDINKSVSQETSGEWRSGYGANRGHRSFVESMLDGGGGYDTLYYRNAPANTAIANTDRGYVASSFAIGPNDKLNVLVDGDTASKQYAIKMYRTVKPQPNTTFGDTDKEFVDADNGDASLSEAFGSSFDFNDFAIYGKAREITHEGTVNAMLWRYYRYGEEGDRARVAYTYPRAASSAVAVSAAVTNSGYLDIDVSLPSGAARAGYSIDSNAKIGLGMKTYGTNGYELIYIAGLYVSSIAFDMASTVTATLAAPTGWGATITDCGLAAGNVIYFKSNDNVNYPSGIKIIDSVAGMDISWTEVPLAGVNPLANAGSVFVGNSPQVIAAESTFSGGSIAVGDIMNIDDTTGFGDGDPTGGLYYGVPYQDRVMRVETIDGGGNSVSGTTTVITGLDSGGVSRAITLTATTTYPLWRPVSNVSAFSFYPIDTGANSTADIATAVNALAAATNSTCPVTATALDAGTVSQSTADEFLDTTDGAGYVYSDHDWHMKLCDGVHYIKVTTVPPAPGDNYKLSVKEPLVGLHTTGADVDYDNETMRLVPVTADAVARFLNSHGAGALAASAVASATYEGEVQIESIADGTTGAVQVQSGSANTVEASVVGAATAGVATAEAIIPTAAAEGFVGGKWVELQNQLPAPRVGAITANTVVQTVDNATGQITFNNGLGQPRAWTQKETAENIKFSVRKHGNFAAYVIDDTGRQVADLSGEGDYINFRNKQISVDTGSHAGPTATLTVPCSNAATGHGFIAGDYITVVSTTDSNYPAGTYLVTAVGVIGATQTVSYVDNGSGVLAGTVVIEPANKLSDTNLGQFKIVRGTSVGTVDYCVWVENPNAIEEVGGATFTVIDQGSILQGDKIQFNQAHFGGNMEGTWTVTSLGLDENTTPEWKFNVVNDSGAYPLATTNVPGQISNVSDIVVKEPTATSVYKRLVAVYPNQDNGAYTNLVFDTFEALDGISAAYQTKAIAMDKFSFDTSEYQGKAGYEYSGGLVGLANKVVYGEDNNTLVYPGVAAVGANINIEGPVVKRLRFALAVRARTGTSRKDIETNVKSAVAAVVNGWPSGESIAISEVVAAAQKVQGVVAVTVTYPTYTATSDRVPVAINERPLVLDATSDITVSFVGA